MAKRGETATKTSELGPPDYFGAIESSCSKECSKPAPASTEPRTLDDWENVGAPSMFDDMQAVEQPKSELSESEASNKSWERIKAREKLKARVRDNTLKRGTRKKKVKKKVDKEVQADGNDSESSIIDGLCCQRNQVSRNVGVVKVGKPPTQKKAVKKKQLASQRPTSPVHASPERLASSFKCASPERKPPKVRCSKPGKTRGSEWIMRKAAALLAQRIIEEKLAS